MSVTFITIMAKKIKDYYDRECARMISHKILQGTDNFKSAEFLSFISQWEKDDPGKETLWIIKHGRRSLKAKDD